MKGDPYRASALHQCNTPRCLDESFNSDSKASKGCEIELKKFYQSFKLQFSMPGDRFLVEEDEKLIDFVAGYPILWNMANSEWKNQHKKDLTWKAVGKRIGKTDVQCKSRWKSIRDHHRKKMKQEKEMPTGSVAAKKRAAYWDRLWFLESVKDEAQSSCDAKTHDTETREDDADDPDSQQSPDASPQPVLLSPEAVVAPPSPWRPPANMHPEDWDPLSRPSCRRAKLLRKGKSVLKGIVSKRLKDRQHMNYYLDEVLQKESEDEHDLFFKSMALSVKKLRPELIAKAKKKIFAVVMDLENENRQTTIIHHGNVSNAHHQTNKYHDSSRASSSTSSTTTISD